MFRFLCISVCCAIAFSFATVGRANDLPVERIASALTLIDLGRTTEDVDLLLSGLDILLAQNFDATQATNLLEAWQMEARFLLRGDDVLTARLQQISSRATPKGPWPTVLLEPTGSFSVPEGFAISVFRSFSGLGPEDSFLPAVTDCARNGYHWTCSDAQALTSKWFTVTSEVGLWAIVQLKPLSQ